MSQGDVVAHMRHISRAITILSDTQVPAMLRTAMVVAVFLQTKVQLFLRRRQHEPILRYFTADATSLLCSSVLAAKHSVQTVWRKGRALHEMLLQRLCFLAGCGKRRDVVHLVLPPRSIDQGKTAWHHFTAATEASGTLRSLGHRGISISHFWLTEQCMSP